MTTTPPEAPSGQPAGSPDDGGPRVSRDDMRDLGRLRRSAHDRKVAGVAGGLARHLDIDPLILRVAFVVLVFFGGAGLILYGACWLLVPDEESGEAPVTLDDRSRTVALLIVGAIATFALIGDSWGVFWFPWPLAIIALVVLFFVTRKDRPGPPPGPWASQPTQGAQYGPAAPTAGTAPTAPGQPAPEYTPQPEQWNAPTYPGYTGYAASPDPEGYGGGTDPQAPVQRRSPRDPRRRGPILFWFTLALITLGIGVLGTLDVAGLAVADSAYPAVAVGITGVMLLVGAFYGRAGGLILLGLVTAIGLAGATAADNWDGTTRHHTPGTAADVQGRYDFGAGELVLDLTQVGDPSNLDGRDIDIEGGAGEIEVIVPDGVDVDVDASVGGPGDVSLFGEHNGGIGTDVTRQYNGGPNAPDIHIDAQMGVGSITVRTE
jgi:phage shock protein PspC (stress-responsive transcriptional regulator)